MLKACLSATSASAATPTSIWSNVREDDRTKQRIIANLGLKGWSWRMAISTAWRARSPGWRSARWCCRWTRARPRRMRCAGGSARRRC